MRLEIYVDQEENMFRLDRNLSKVGIKSYLWEKNPSTGERYIDAEFIENYTPITNVPGVISVRVIEDRDRPKL